MSIWTTFAEGLAGSSANSLVNGITSIFNHSSQKRENERNRDFTREMFDKQIQNNIKMWNMQKEYDLPKNQIERMRQAGLNPDLMYNGAGVSASPNLQSASPSGFSSGFSPVSFGNLDPETASRIKLNNSQAGLLDSQKTGVDITNENLGDLLFEQVDSLRASNALSTQQAQTLNGQLQVFLDTSKSIRADIEIKDIQKEIFKLQKEYDEKSLKDRLSITEDEATIMSNNVDYWLEGFEAYLANLRASTGNISAQTVLLEMNQKIIQPMLDFIEKHPKWVEAGNYLSIIGDVLGNLTTLLSTFISARSKIGSPADAGEKVGRVIVNVGKGGGR